MRQLVLSTGSRLIEADPSREELDSHEKSTCCTMMHSHWYSQPSRSGSDGSVADSCMFTVLNATEHAAAIAAPN